MSDPKANSYQVGGRHYKTAYEHWDLVVNVAMGYIEGNATKYIARWRQKGGLNDLQKALHYVNKLIERKTEALLTRRVNNILGKEWVLCEVNRFCEINRLAGPERRIIEGLASWRSADDLVAVRDDITMLMEQLDAGAAAVPLTEENKHALMDQEG